MRSRPQKWQNDVAFNKLCAANHIKLVLLDPSSTNELFELLQRNNKVEGFAQMDDRFIDIDMLTSIALNNTLNNKEGRVILARDCRPEKNNQLLGFIRIKRVDDEQCAISELGVDNTYSFHHRKESDPKSIGKALMYAGCSELAASITSENAILGVYSSTDESNVYYEKYGFIHPDFDHIDDGEYIIELKDSDKIFSYALAGLKKTAEKFTPHQATSSNKGLFQTSDDSQANIENSQDNNNNAVNNRPGNPNNT